MCLRGCGDSRCTGSCICNRFSFTREESVVPGVFARVGVGAAADARVPLLTEAKLELLDGFKPFIDHEAVDVIHLDLLFAGGSTGVRKIVAYAYVERMPVGLHNVGSLILTCANAHFGASIQNFYRSESQLGEHDNYIYIYGMAVTPLEVKNSRLKVPTGPGLGLEINPDLLKKNLSEGEVYWG